MMRYSALVPWLCVGGAWCLLNGAAAQPAPSPAEREYQQLIERGVEEFDLGHFEEARAVFQRAHDQRPSARTLRALGLIEFELRHYVRAERLLAAALTDRRRPLPEELRAQVEEALQRARTYLGRFELELEPKDARLSIDGRAITPGPGGTISLNPGEHKLIVTRPGYRKLTRELDVVGGQYATLELSLQPETAPPESDNTTEQPARSAAASPVQSVAPSSGTAPVIFLVAGGTALATGATLGALALSSSARDASEDEATRAHGFALAADVSFALGALATGVGLWLLFSEDEPSSRAVVLEPALGRGLVGASTRGRF